MDKKMMILIGFFSVATFISSVIGSCIVFYNEKARTDINSNKVLAATDIYKSVSINYYNNNLLKLNALQPGFSFEHKFSITNNNSNEINYDIVWNNVSSTWHYSENGMEAHPEEFIYSLTCSDGQKITNTPMPIDEKNNNIIFENQSLKTNKTNECTLKVTFISTGMDQSYNLNRSFGGEYKVIVKE